MAEQAIRAEEPLSHALAGWRLWIGDAVPMPLGYAAALSAVGGDATPFLE